MSPLSIDVPYSGGQIDASLDLGADVILFEFKGSLLKVDAKYKRNVTAFQDDFRLKFIENEKGEPKTLRQLATSSAAIASGLLKTSTAPRRIYPVFVGYEFTLDAFWINRYADDLFRDLLPSGLRGRVRPLTVMSVEALEGALPYFVAGDFTWMELLESRFIGDKVSELSVYQKIHDWRSKHNQDVRRNQFILKHFESIFEKALAKFKDDSPSKGSTV